MTIIIPIILAFAAGTLAVFGVYLLMKDVSRRGRLGESFRLHEEFDDVRRDEKSPLFKDLGKLASESAAAMGQSLSLKRRLEILIEQSGMNLTVRLLIAYSVGAGIISALIGVAVAFFVGHPPYLGLAAGVIGCLVPYCYVSFARRRRLEKMLSQLPDALDSMVSAVRAGRSMTHAMQEIADHGRQPLSTEFGHCIAQQDMGLSPEAAVRDLSMRTGLLEVKILAFTLLIQRQTGGNFAELLERLAKIIRERFRIAGQIKTLTAEGRLQANVLIALPPALLAILMTLSPNYAQVLFQRPDMLLGGLAGMVIGLIWIRRIVNFDF